MRKIISPIIAFSIIFTITGIVGVVIFLFSQEVRDHFLIKEEVIEETIEKEELKLVGNVVKEFMEEAYIKRNYKNASKLFIPPQEFEKSLSTDPMSLEDYIEWFVKSVNLDSYGENGVYSVRIKNVEKYDKKEEFGICSFRDEDNDVDFFTVTFQFIKENNEALYFGPCCGADEPSFSDWFSCVKSTDNGYKVYKNLPYLP